MFALQHACAKSVSKEETPMPYGDDPGFDMAMRDFEEANYPDDYDDYDDKYCDEKYDEYDGY